MSVDKVIVQYSNGGIILVFGAFANAGLSTGARLHLQKTSFVILLVSAIEQRET